MISAINNLKDPNIAMIVVLDKLVCKILLLNYHIQILEYTNYYQKLLSRITSATKELRERPAISKKSNDNDNLLMSRYYRGSIWAYKNIELA